MLVHPYPKVKIADKKAVMASHGIKLWSLKRPEITAAYYLARYCQFPGKISKAIQINKALADAVSDDGFYRYLNENLEETGSK